MRERLNEKGAGPKSLALREYMARNNAGAGTWRRQPVPAEVKDDPFVVISETFGYMGVTCTVRERVDKIRRSEDLAWLRRVLSWKDTELSVRQAAARRIRRLMLGRGEGAAMLALFAAGLAMIVIAFWA